MSNKGSATALDPTTQHHAPVGKIGNFLDFVDFFFGAVFFVRHGCNCFTSKVVGIVETSVVAFSLK